MRSVKFLFAGFANTLIFSPSIISITGDFVHQAAVLTDYVLETLAELPEGEYWIHFAGWQQTILNIMTLLSNFF